MTDSVIGSDDVLWFRFVSLDADGAGITIFFSDPPKYAIGYCQSNAEFDIPVPDSSKYRVWTFKKQNNVMQLLCNDVKLHELDLDEVPKSQECHKRWSRKFTHVQFVYQHDEPQEPDDQPQPKLKDKASDYMRKYKYGKSFEHLIHTYITNFQVPFVDSPSTYRADAVLQSKNNKNPSKPKEN